MSKSKKRKIEDRRDENREQGFRDRTDQERYTMDERGVHHRPSNVSLLEQLLDLAQEIEYEN